MITNLMPSGNNMPTSGGSIRHLREFDAFFGDIVAALLQYCVGWSVRKQQLSGSVKPRFSWLEIAPEMKIEHSYEENAGSSTVLYSLEQISTTLSNMQPGTCRDRKTR